MIEALRGLGYNTATALADIIDNSIAARARAVELNFVWAGAHSRIEIRDDGTGMNAAELDRAMRLGEKNPLDVRSDSDLGRFGLGLKTASFSQCRRLTVATVGADGLQCLRWDLDVLAASADDGWHLLEGPDESSASLVESFGASGCGTLVLLEVLDRVVTTGFGEQDFLDLIDRVEGHLAMVFHRFLEGTKPRLRIRINGRGVSPWDPFLSGHPAKPWHSPVSTFGATSGVEVECHVLPHKDRLTEKEYESAQGPDGWTAQQGFYVYRNQRLLVAGSWLGLGQRRGWTKDEAHRLARIRLDIPNSADADWKIDIRKSTARPPVAVRAWLIRLAEETRTRARRAFAQRGQAPRAPGGKEVSQAWRADHFSGGMRYRIDTDHPAVRAVLDEANGLLPQIRAMLRIIEETVPVQRIWLDTAENRETPRTGFAGEPPAAVTEILHVLYRNMVRIKGMSPEMARSRILLSEPFQNYPDLVAALTDDE
ncbi:ATP-binding protein [Pseudoduganella sp. FT93W]|uniref:ATP-binding protein n=1 Tax=Duganella fentianensis TaxID=2692177 RepID=A0A845I2G4_9BURK|nr:MZA anti-phage system associated ATPase MzaB [Duganella fentianensis]MYN45901.1 ATP-binding protein [Duganella fentianensis]